MSDWVKEYFAAVDSMDIDAFLNHLTDDVVVNAFAVPSAAVVDLLSMSAACSAETARPAQANNNAPRVSTPSEGCVCSKVTSPWASSPYAFATSGKCAPSAEMAAAPCAGAGS